ncbi:serine carboxypeptidase domain-containing protein [Rhizoctonia solani AG-1 IA]|uniref:Serine carboxypeptidase domain-containing protein n=1 Tax=Thanatephorus cucumeris (strain AG1-IA) TaxID=983506 RepID=L8WF95_THACA|nr:serine carboxypeptidase domain-containing protein [Rhizoctonia solani AG-1 IA]
MRYLDHDIRSCKHSCVRMCSGFQVRDYTSLPSIKLANDTYGNIGSFDSQQGPIYFNRTDVQDAIHAPHINWSECSSINVFVNGTDTSIPPMLSVMPNVIEKSERTVVMHGGIDYVLIAEGTRHSGPEVFCIAKILFTGHGQQGFQRPIANESFIIEGFGILGAMHQERIDLSGHMMPLYAPWAAYKTLSYLLGREELTDHTNDAALYPSAYELYGSASSKKVVNRHRTEL